MDRRQEQLLEWQRRLMDEGPVGMADTVHRYCRFMNENGVPLCRSTLALFTLHPQIQALRYVWFDDDRDPGAFPSPALFLREIHHPDGCTIDEALMSHGAKDTPQYRQSPFYQLLMGEPRLSFRLVPGGKHDYPVLDDLAAEGVSHYVAYPLPGQDGQISLVTRHPGGFSDDDVAFIEQSLICLSLLLTSATKDLILDTVLDCYIGHSPAGEVKRGNIRPGTMLDLRGAIWFSDIRGYSTHAQNSEPAEFIGKLNAYYEAVVTAIHAEGGEVLKFIGDAVLAIFVDDDRHADACQRALAAAHAANRGLAENRIEFDHGVGLHLGQFQFGNIGSLRRMDFTVIGSDVNFASRIESQCATLGVRLLMSEAFAARCGQAASPVALSALKGFVGEHRLYTVATAA